MALGATPSKPVSLSFHSGALRPACAARGTDGALSATVDSSDCTRPVSLWLFFFPSCFRNHVIYSKHIC